MAKKKNFETLFKALKDAGWTQNHAQSIYDDMAKAYLAANPGKTSYADYLDSLSQLAFQDELEKNIRPFVKDRALRFARKYQGTNYDKENLRNFLKATANSIDREKFLNMLGRKSEETVDKDGNKVRKDRHIGRLTDEDYDNLYLEGLDREYVNELAQRFRDQYIKEYAEKVLADREKRMQDARNSVVKEYNKSPLSGMLKAVSPELYAEGVNAMSRGEDIPGHRLGGAISKDFARNASILASAAMPNPFLTAAGVFGTEMAFNGASPNYKQDANQAAMAGVAAGTIPSVVNRVISGGMRVPIRSLQNAIKNASKKLKRGEISPARQELDTKRDNLDKAIQTYYASKAEGTGVRSKDSREMLTRMADDMNNSYMAVTDNTVGKWTVADVEELMRTPEGQNTLRAYLATAPKKDVYINRTDVIKMPKTLSDEEEFMIRQSSEEWLNRAQDQWPATTEEFVTLPVSAAQRRLNLAAEAALGTLNAAGGVVEPISTRAGAAMPYGRGDNGLILIEDWKKKYQE